MKKLVPSIILLWGVFNTFSFGQTGPPRNNFGFGVAYISSMTEGIYFDDPWDFWPNREPSYMIQGSYSRQLNQSFRTGAYVEYERIRFSTRNNDSIHSFRRYNLGLEWIGQYPSTPLHLQLGGYMGYGFLMANHWDNLKGFDFGMIAGPAYETQHIGLCVQVRSGYAPYSSNDTPSGVLLFNPKFLLRVYYRF